MTGPRRLLIGGLLAILVLVIVQGHVGTIWPVARPGVDLERPLVAADRWLSGGLVYDPGAFNAGAGLGQPFLYPPYTIPIFAALTGVPRQPLLWAAVLLSFLVAVAACRRLQIPWIWIPLVLAWPPFTEGILDANIQIPMFAAFVFLFYRPDGNSWRPTPRDVSSPAEPAVMIATLSTFIGMFKVSLPHPWLFVLRQRPRAALAGALVLALFVGATLFVAPFDLWSAWLEQLRLASDPTWFFGGFALQRIVGVLAYPIAAASLIALWFVPRRDPAPWVGILSVVGSLSLHIFGFLFLIPAMLKVRPEVAIVAASLIAGYGYVGPWVGTAILLWSLLVLSVGTPRWREALAAQETLGAG